MGYKVLLGCIMGSLGTVRSGCIIVLSASVSFSVRVVDKIIQAFSMFCALAHVHYRGIG